MVPSPRQAAPHAGSSFGALAASYALYFGAVGITLPFLPEYLRRQQLSASQVGVLLAIGPALTLVAPPLWGQLADRLGRPGRVFAAAALGAGLACLPLGLASGFGALFAALALYATFASALTVLIDAQAVRFVARQGGSYARLRLFGSLGFVVSSLAFGKLVGVIDVRTVAVPGVLLALAGLWAAATLGRAPSEPLGGPKPSLRAGLGLAKNPQVLRLLLAGALHWVACAPYHATFSLYATDLKLSALTVGLAASVGVVSELTVMALWQRLGARHPTRLVLAVAFLASAGRWWGMAAASTELALAGLACVHGLTFGAFYICAVELLAREVPDTLRASGQALFVACVFGLGGLVGNLLAGLGYGLLGGAALFALAGALELLPAALVLWPARRIPQEPGRR